MWSSRLAYFVLGELTCLETLLCAGGASEGGWLWPGAVLDCSPGNK